MAGPISASTPPPSPQISPEDDSLPILTTDDFGMLADDELDDEQPRPPIQATKKKPPRRTPQTGRRKYVTASRHFASAKVLIRTPPATPQKALAGHHLRVEDLSSDSSLTDVPSDIGSDPFLSEPEPKTPRKRRTTTTTRSPYFPNKPRPQFLSCLPFPSLSAPKFGLMQERLAHDPFRLLIATIFLNRTKGEHAMPVFFQLMEKYPTIEALASAQVEHITEIIHKLGFQHQRARKCVEMAKEWQKSPPAKSRRFRKINYPLKGDGRDIPQGETVGDDDGRVAWEISHLPGLGPYSHDSWRIFCRDNLRGLPKSDEKEDSTGFEPEWKRVLPTDKELRAYLTWMWLKEGWTWNKETGQRTKADGALLQKALGGGVVLERPGLDHLQISTTNNNTDETRPAGIYLPRDLGAVSGTAAGDGNTLKP